MTIMIREAVEADVEGIARVHVQSWRETYKDFLAPKTLADLSVEDRALMWRGAFTHHNPRAKLLVAEDNGEIVGFARGGPIRASGADLLGTDTEIFAIYVIDSVKRRGIGKRLIAGIFEHLAAQGFRSAGLTVLKDNVPARRFYEQLGGQAGAERSFDLNGQSVTELVYRFEPIPEVR